MSHTFFIAGTDTGVGKTLVAAGLLLAAEQRGLSTAAMKPVAAGCDAQGHNEDALVLQAAMTLQLDYQQVNPVALSPAIAPHIAAAQAGRSLEVARLAGYCRGTMSAGADVLLVEGAGGWRVPLNERQTLADLAVELRTPVILVVAMRLGCINHALLTAEAIAHDGLPLAGWVANSCGATMTCYRENLQALRSRLHAPLLGEIPDLETAVPQRAAAYLDWSPLLGPAPGVNRA